MTIRERIILELDQTPDFLLEQVFNFLRFLRTLYQSQAPVVVLHKPHPLSGLSFEERQQRIHASVGAWKDDPEVDQIFAEIDRDRHGDYGRPIDSFDD